MGLITAFVGWASSFTVVIQGLVGVGATQAQAASGLFAASLAMGAAGVWTSLRSRQPISIAWVDARRSTARHVRRGRRRLCGSCRRVSSSAAR